MNDLRYYAAHKSDCGWMPPYNAHSGIAQPCRCGLFDLFAAPGASDAAFRPFVCHDRICAWSRSVQHAQPRAACDCGLMGLLAHIGPAADPATRRREAQMADPTRVNPPGYQVY
jgi:hypothetical protein